MHYVSVRSMVWPHLLVLFFVLIFYCLVVDPTMDDLEDSEIISEKKLSGFMDGVKLVNFYCNITQLNHLLFIYLFVWYSWFLLKCVGKITSQLSWFKSQHPFQHSCWFAQDSCANTEWGFISSEHGFSSCSAYFTSRSAHEILFVIFNFMVIINKCISTWWLFIMLLCDSSVGTNIGDIGLWDVDSREKLLSRNFKVWHIGACSMLFKVCTLPNQNHVTSCWECSILI